jgi:hypothetical protein
MAPYSAQRLHRLGDGRLFLPDGYVDALHALTLLVQDRVDGDGGLARLAVADDQLPLTAADRRHGVDGLDAGLHRLAHGLATHDRRRLDLDAADDGASDRTLAVDGSPSAFTTRPSMASPTGTERIRPVDFTVWPSSTAFGFAEHHGADRVVVEVQGEAGGAVLELEQLVDAALREAGHAGDAVADLRDPARRCEPRARARTPRGAS